MKNLFSEFKKVPKEEWIQKIEHDLKGRALEELNWQLEAGLEIKPFYTDEDLGVEQAITDTRNDNSWKVGEDFVVNDLRSANIELIHALENGVNSPRMIIKDALGNNGMSILFKGVIPSYLFLRIELLLPTLESLTFIKNLHKHFNEEGYDCNLLEGAFEIDGTDWEPQLVKSIKSLFSKFEFVVNGKSLYQPVSNKTEELLSIIKSLDDPISKGIAPASLRISITVGNSFFVEIAKVRALRLLWYHLLEAWHQERVPLKLDAVAGIEDLLDDENKIKIQVTTQAMSAIIAGVDTLTINPSSKADSKNFAFAKRIARNVQHLLVMESYLDRVVDPAAGSYYVEQLTLKYAELVWERFLEQK